MKKTVRTLLLCALMSHACAHAGELPPAVAQGLQQALQQHWPQQNAQVSAQRQQRRADGGIVWLLQINRQGFVMLAEENGAARLLAYGQQGGADLFDEDAHDPLWLGGSPRADAAKPKAAQALPKAAPQLAPAAVVAPLTRSNWGQSGYYNDSTPPDGNTVPTGCVATAMAQVMRHFEHPLRPKPISISYQHQTTTADGQPLSYGTLSADLSQVEYQWQNMPDVLSAPHKPLADLMYQLGVSLKMRYRPGFSSNAYFDEIPRSLRNHFGYQSSDALFRSNYSAQAWQDLLANELRQQRVILMCGYDYKAGAGHCWVVDGMDERGFVHINWGWDGRYNGYFAADAPLVRSYDFSGYHHVYTVQPGCYQTPSHNLQTGGQAELKNSGFALENTFYWRRSGDPDWIVQRSTGASLNLSGLQADTPYEYKIESVCSRLGRSMSEVLSFRTPVAPRQYCQARGASSSYEWINLLASGTQQVQSGNNQGYADFSHIALSAKSGQALPLRLQAGYNGQPWPLYWNVWLDADNDGAFAAAELLWQGRASGEQNIAPLLPAGLQQGSYRLRVMMSYYPIGSACATLQYGEVEDYSVQIAP
ncbi:C10 family peptidase [Massilia sp. W12]|uniref:C10 family peptidase n=1 Tax=Massilia sp. W12 TaxID=3126507 RepID=UPI0030D4EF72